MRLGREVEDSGLAVPADLHVVGGGGTGRYVCVRQIRKLQQRLFPLMLDRIELEAQLFDLGGPRAAGFLNRGRVLALALRSGNLVARGILLTLEAFHLGNQSAPDGLERRDFLERLVRLQAAPAQAGAHLVNVVPDERRIEHASSAVRSR